MLRLSEVCRNWEFSLQRPALVGICVFALFCSKIAASVNLDEPIANEERMHFYSLTYGEDMNYGTVFGTGKSFLIYISISCIIRREYTYIFVHAFWHPDFIFWTVAI